MSEVYNVIVMNVLYAIFSGVLTMLFMRAGYHFFDSLTFFSTSEELQKANIAVGLVVAGIFIGVGLAMGLVVGLALN